MPHHSVLIGGPGWACDPDVSPQLTLVKPSPSTIHQLSQLLRRGCSRELGWSGDRQNSGQYWGQRDQLQANPPRPPLGFEALSSPSSVSSLALPMVPSPSSNDKEKNGNKSTQLDSSVGVAGSSVEHRPRQDFQGLPPPRRCLRKTGLLR